MEFTSYLQNLWNIFEISQKVSGGEVMYRSVFIWHLADLLL